MTFKYKTLILACSILSVGASSAMASDRGFYVGGGAGAVLTQTQHATNRYGSSQIGNAPGFGGYADFGYSYGNGLRAEVEGLYLQDHTNRLSPNNAHGHQQTYGAMLNVLYDIDLKMFNIDAPITPYVGVGAGYLVNTLNTHSPTSYVRGTQGSFGYQGIVGAAYHTPIDGLDVTADYRMIGQTMSNDSYHEYDTHLDHKFNHTFNVGLRYQFGSKNATPVVISDTPTPAPSRTYMVFFGWDQYSLDVSAKEIINKAASVSNSLKVTKIYVNGYTDTSSARGGASGKEYNYNLSVKRADAVKAELIRDGLSENEIVTKGYGETNLLVQTGSNVRDPQNRRVEIILR